MKTIAIDFDGVIHRYSKGWKDGSIYDQPIDNAFKSIKNLMEQGYYVFIHSTRDPHQIQQWMNERQDYFKVQTISSSELDHGKFWNKNDVVGVTQFKLPADLYVDDRALKFDGDWSKTLFIIKTLTK